MAQCCAGLLLQDFSCSARIIFRFGIADADQRQKAMLQGGFHLERHGLIGLVEKGAAFAVAEFHHGGPAVLHHRRRDLTGPGTLIIPVHVLGTDLHARSAQNICHLGDIGKGWNDEGWANSYVGQMDEALRVCAKFIASARTLFIFQLVPIQGFSLPSVKTCPGAGSPIGHGFFER